jgi:hypothetical protein
MVVRPSNSPTVVRAIIHTVLKLTMLKLTTLKSAMPSLTTL